MPVSLPAGAFIQLAPPDDLDVRIAELTAERTAFIEDVAAREGLRDRGSTGARSPKRAVRARASERAQRKLERYNAVCREIDRLTEIKRQRPTPMADWIRSRPRAAQLVMCRLPPAATVTLR